MAFPCLPEEDSTDVLAGPRLLSGQGVPGERAVMDGLAFLSVLDIFTLVSWLKKAQRKRKTFPPQVHSTD